MEYAQLDGGTFCIVAEVHVVYAYLIRCTSSINTIGIIKGILHSFVVIDATQILSINKFHSKQNKRDNL